MVHKAFEIIGEKARLEIVIGHPQKLFWHSEGIFQESLFYETAVEGRTRPALDFIEPLYDPLKFQEQMAKGAILQDRINPENPIIHFLANVDSKELLYAGKADGKHVFKGELNCRMVDYFNDGDDRFKRYKEPLKKAGFTVF